MADLNEQLADFLHENDPDSLTPVPDDDAALQVYIPVGLLRGLKRAERNKLREALGSVQGWLVAEFGATIGTDQYGPPEGAHDAGADDLARLVRRALASNTDGEGGRNG